MAARRLGLIHPTTPDGPQAETPRTGSEWSSGEKKRGTLYFRSRLPNELARTSSQRVTTEIVQNQT